MKKKRNVLYATLTPRLGVEMRSKKTNGHHIIRQNLMENQKKFVFYFFIGQKFETYIWNIYSSCLNFTDLNSS